MMNNSKSDELKAAAKTADTKAAEPKATPSSAVKKEAAKTTAAKKETAEKKAAPAKKEAAPKKEAAKKEAAPRKAAAPKKAAAKKEAVSSVVIEYAGKQIVAKEVLEAAKNAYESLNKGVEINTIEIYVKPEENAAYYVVNGEGSAEYKVLL